MSDRLRAHQASADPFAIRQAPPSRLPDRSAEAAGRGEAATPGSISLETVLNRIHALPALTNVVVRSLQLVDKETISAREIVALINTDLMFSARVIKAANAPCYGLPRTVAAVNDAVLLLGTDAIREVVLVAAARDIFHRPLTGYGLTGPQMWAHSLSCAFAAEAAAEITGYSNRTEAFIAGLVHDVGKIVLDEDMQSAAPFVREHALRESATFVDAERAVLGYDHCDIGGRVLRSWGIPQHIVQAVALHRKPVVNRQTVPLAGLVHLGEALCSMAGVGTGYEGLDITLDTQVLSDFKFTEEMGDLTVSRIVDKLAASESLLRAPAPAAVRAA